MYKIYLAFLLEYYFLFNMCIYTMMVYTFFVEKILDEHEVPRYPHKVHKQE